MIVTIEAMPSRTEHLALPVGRAVRRGGRVARRAIRAASRRVMAPIAIFGYHRVAEPACDPWELAVAPERFDAQLQVLEAHGQIVPLARIPQANGLGRLRHRRALFALTFDDGYADNLHTALPILERHDAPATVFIATGMLDKPWFWWDLLAQVMEGPDVDPDRVVAACLDRQLIDQAELEDVVPELHVVVHTRLKGRPLSEIEEVVASVAEEVGVAADPADRPLTTDELRTLAAHPLIQIGGHTVSHAWLPGMGVERVRAEVREGMAALDELVPTRDPRPFAYPYGAYHRAAVDVARTLGIPTAVTTEPRTVGLRDAPLELPRHTPVDSERPSFEIWLRKAVLGRRVPSGVVQGPLTARPVTITG